MNFIGGLVIAFAIGSILGTSVGGVMALFDKLPKQIIHDNAIEECERNLPRTETCVITAVPQKDTTGEE